MEIAKKASESFLYHGIKYEIFGFNRKWLYFIFKY